MEWLLRAMLTEAVAAVDGAIAARLERQFRHAATVAACGLEHFALRTIVGPAVAAPLIALAAAAAAIRAAAALCLAGFATCRTTTGVVCKAFLGVEILFTSGECKLRIAIGAREVSIGVQHWYSSQRSFMTAAAVGFTF
jgi:hypothetical protein